MRGPIKVSSECWHRRRSAKLGAELRVKAVRGRKREEGHVDAGGRHVDEKLIEIAVAWGKNRKWKDEHVEDVSEKNVLIGTGAVWGMKRGKGQEKCVWGIGENCTDWVWGCMGKEIQRRICGAIDKKL